MFVRCADNKGLLLSLMMSREAAERTWSLLVVVAQLERFLLRLRVMQ